MAAKLEHFGRENLAELLSRLFAVVHQPRPARNYAGYASQQMSVPARHAAYSASLALLAVCVAGSIKASELYGTQEDTATA